MAGIVAPRTPWPTNFPDVMVHAPLSLRDRHPKFAAAKAGDIEAAISLVRDLAFGEGGGWEPLRRFIDTDVVLLPVSAIETEGFNAIPDALARLCGAALGLEVRAGDVIQANRVGHTRASGWHRLVTPAIFEGAVDVGRDHVLVDDHVGLGGTLANLRWYIEARGARVVGMTTLTETRAARVIAIRPETLSVLRSRHGQRLQDLWLEHFGYGLDCLTEVEAGYLARQRSVDDIREGLAQAAEQARRRGFRPVAIEGGG